MKLWISQKGDTIGEYKIDNIGVIGRSIVMFKRRFDGKLIEYNLRYDDGWWFKIEHPDNTEPIRVLNWGVDK